MLCGQQCNQCFKYLGKERSVRVFSEQPTPPRPAGRPRFGRIRRDGFRRRGRPAQFLFVTWAPSASYRRKNSPRDRTFLSSLELSGLLQAPQSAQIKRPNGPASPANQNCGQANSVDHGSSTGIQSYDLDREFMRETLGRRNRCHRQRSPRSS